MNFLNHKRISTFTKFSKFKNLYLFFFIFLFSATYIWLAKIHINQINQNKFKSDQSHNIAQAERYQKIRNSNNLTSYSEKIYNHLPHFTDGVVHPLMPWISSFFVKIDDDRNFIKGKIFNSAMALVFCILLGIYSSIYLKFSLIASINITLLAGFGVFLKRATFFQPEPIFYIFFLLSWIYCLNLLNRNKISSYFILGLISGLAYLAKASITPLLLIFFFLCIFRAIILFLKKAFIKLNIDDYINSWSCSNSIIGGLIFFTVFSMISTPMYIHKNITYGDIFHSFPSYWMWMDRFEPDAYEWMGNHNSKEKLAKLTSETKPSFSVYKKYHTNEEIINRLKNGSLYVLKNFINPRKTNIKKKNTNKKWITVLPSRGHYLIYLLCILIVLFSSCIIKNLLLRKHEVRPIKLINSNSFFMTIFAIGCVTAYILLFGWYSPIGKGERFMLMLYLPICFTLIYSCEMILSKSRSEKLYSKWAYIVYNILMLALTSHIFYRLIQVYKFPFFRN